MSPLYSEKFADDDHVLVVCVLVVFSAINNKQYLNTSKVT